MKNQRRGLLLGDGKHFFAEVQSFLAIINREVARSVTREYAQFVIERLRTCVQALSAVCRPANSHGFTVSLTVSLPCSRAADRISWFLRPANSHGFTNLRWIESHGL